jgi:hypothetical protein
MSMRRGWPSRLLLLGLLVAPPFASLRAEADLSPFLVQSACLDAAGRVRPGATPLDADCARRRPLSAGEPLPYRKHDWPSAGREAAQPRGWQASDSLHGTLSGRPVILHILDFGDDPRRAFGRFDQGLGDGGNLLVTGPGGAAGAAMTEDGGGGVQWFGSPDCARLGGPTGGWLFAVPPATEAWQARVALLGRAPGPQACPARFVPSLTRWRRAGMDLPVREPGNPAIRMAAADVLVSEHFGRADVATAEHLERFFFARDLGFVRWERWEDRATSTQPAIEERAARLAGNRTCPPLALSDPPGPSWAMVACRTWTNLVRATGPGAMLQAPAWPMLPP